MILKEKAQLLTSESKPYKMNGNEGVSHRIRVSVQGEIYPLKATEAQVMQCRQYVGKQGEVTFDLQTRKEALTLQFVDFVVGK